MFVHAPEETEIAVHTLMLWDDPDLAYQAIEICRDIEQRVAEVRFHIEGAEASDLATRESSLRRKACEVDVVLVACHETLCHLPERVKGWFGRWSRERERQAGALAVLRSLDPVACDEFRRLVNDFRGHFPRTSENEEQCRRFFQRCARDAHMEFFWGGLESDLEKATRGLRILRASPPADPVRSPQLKP